MHGPMPGMLGTVFISHSSKDHGAALDLRDLLRRAGYRTWMAPDDILAGRSWTEQIVNGIALSTHVIVLLSKSSTASDHVAREVGLASEQRKPIVPIRIEPVTPTGSLAYILQLVQRVDAFPPPLAQHWPAIAAALGGSSLEGTRGMARVGARNLRVSSRVSPVALGAVAVAAIVTAVGAYLLFGRGGGPSPTPLTSPIAFVSPTPTSAIPSSDGSPPSTSQPGSPTPGSTGTAGPTTTPDASQVEPSPTTVATSTPGPTSIASGLPTPGPSGVLAGGGLGLGADTQILQDDFSVPGNFGTATDAQGSSDYVDGAFQFEVTASGHSRWSYDPLDASYPVLGTSATIQLGKGSPAGSVMCGFAPTNPERTGDDFLYALVTNDNTWVIGKLVANTFDSFANGPLSGPAKLGADGKAQVSIECAQTPAGKDRVRMKVNDIVVADQLVDASFGPFRSPGIEGEAGDKVPSLITFSDLTAVGGDAFSDPTDVLLTHIASTVAGTCKGKLPAQTRGQVATVTCTKPGTPDKAIYDQYDSQAAMQQAFTFMIPDGATGTDCKKGASTYGYSINNVHVGRLTCFTDPKNAGGVLFAWTDERMNILSAATLASGSYGDLYDWWNSADSGPVP